MSCKDNIQVSDDFKKEFLTEMLDTMYHGEKDQDGGVWAEIYRYETDNIFSDILRFINDVKRTGRILTKTSLVDFIIFAENEHIGNDLLIGEGFSQKETERLEELAKKLINLTEIR